MKSEIQNPKPKTHTDRCRLSCALAALSLAVLPADAWEVATNLTVKAELSAKEAYDSNVYLQDHEPDTEAVPRAVRPDQDSFVTSVTPKMSLDWRPCTAFSASVSYAPEVTFYHAESSEDSVAHRGGINLRGEVGDVPWDMPNSITFIDGSRTGLYYGVSSLPGRLDGVPAIGGVPVRDRREQFVYRGRFKATWSVGAIFIRPVVAAYVHDFQTKQKHNGSLLPDGSPNPDWGYENYVDRTALDYGLDVGWSVHAQTKLYAGYRYRNEFEGTMVGSPYSYDAQVHRPLVGIEGKPVSWLTADVSIGPDIHHTTSRHDPAFDPDYTALWVDAVVTLTPTAKDSITLIWRQNTQPAFSSPSIYEDIVYEGTVRHRLDDQWSVGGGFRAYLGDWYDPVVRRDWIFTPSASVTYKHDAHLSAEVSYSYDWVDSRVPDTKGREFTRHLAWLAVKYAF